MTEWRNSPKAVGQKMTKDNAPGEGWELALLVRKDPHPLWGAPVHPGKKVIELHG